MAIEIERKYLVLDSRWRSAVVSQSHIRQGYLAQNERVEVRVRIKSDGNATLTVKASGGGVERAEFECDTTLKDAEALLQHCGGQVIEKMRYTVLEQGRHWLVDEYRGRLAPLVLAEIELTRAEDAPDPLPDWIGAEVSDRAEYSNARLATCGLPQTGNAP